MRRIVPNIFFVIVLGMAAAGCAHHTGLGRSLAALSGGNGTVFNDTGIGFSLPLADLPTTKQSDFTFGNRLFNTNWVTAPSSTKKFDGLGPTFNRISCSGCHTFDGRGRPPDAGDRMQSMLVRISVPGQNAHGGPKPHPHYGDQINDRSIRGVPAEGRVNVRYQDEKHYYPDGGTYYLRVPHYAFEDLAFGPLGDDIMFSPRVAPAVFGLGLLESVPASTILGFSKSQATNRNGIRGHPNYVWDITLQQRVLGRFGWKANQPSLRQQDGSAFVGDIGITNPVVTQENIPDVQIDAKKAPNGGSPEINDDFFASLLFYSRTLAVPARRDTDDHEVKKGERIFKRVGCAVCHIPTMQTGSNDEIPQLAHQTIHPFTDMLLHDMGPELADNRPDFEASGSQWRTPPLWGIGLVKTVNKHTLFMHDGRARNLEEAILWHGGEAQHSKEQFMNISPHDRQTLLKFLESL